VTTLLIAALVVAALPWLLLVNQWSPVRRTQVTAALLALQLQIPSIPVPIGYVWVIVTLPAVLLAGLRGRPRLSLCIWALAFISMVSVLYSPNRDRAMGATVALVAFAAVCMDVECMRSPSRKSTISVLAAVMKAVAPVVVVQAASTIIFRVLPNVERTYLLSSASRLFLGGEGQAAYTVNLNNVRFPFKAGGILFVNGNKASLFLGVAALVAFFLYRHAKSRYWLGLALVSTLGVLASGSKTGMVLLVIVPCLTAVYGRLIDGQRHAPLVSAVPVGALLVIAIAFTALSSIASSQVDPVTGRSHAADVAAAGRVEMWRQVDQFSDDHVIGGLGYGGWQQRSALITGDPRGLPPHNIYISSWANTGLLGLVSTAAFTLLVLQRLASRRLRYPFILEATERRSATCAFGSFLWITLHGQADNTEIYGVSGLICILAVLVARPFATAGTPVSLKSSAKPTVTQTSLFGSGRV
jgi:hypothetical protein